MQMVGNGRWAARSRTALGALACGLAFVMTAGSAAATPALMAQSPGAYHSGDAATVERAFSGSQYIGASLARDIVNYDNGFSWSTTDKFVADASGHGLTPYLTLTYQPAGYGGSRTVTTSDFASFCSSAASRYPGVSAFGVMNEPNSYTYNWFDGVHAAHAVDYGNLYRACYSAIKGVNSSARVYIGELANATDSPCNYITNAVAATMTRTDGVAIHPYQFDVTPTSQLSGATCRGIGRLGDWTTSLSGMTNLKTPSGSVPPLAITEFGYCADADAAPCSGGSAPRGEDARAGWLGSALSKANTAGATIFAYYHLVKAPGSSFDTGIMGTDGSVTSSMNTLRSFSGTTCCRPDAASGSATQIGSRSAVVGGSVNPRGLKTTTYHFEYGTSSSSLSSSTDTHDAGNDVSSGAVTATITGLAPGTQYYFRIVAQGPGGTSVGSTQSFTTLETPTFMGVVASDVAEFQQQPFSTNWNPIANYGTQLAFATPRTGSPMVATLSDQDRNGQGSVWFANWPAFSSWLGPVSLDTADDLALSAPTSGGIVMAAIDRSSDVMAFQQYPFSADGWRAIAQPAKSLVLTSPAEGGTTAFVIDKSNGIAYYHDWPFAATGWHAISNDVAELAATSPRSGGEVVAAINATTHELYYMNSPFDGHWNYTGNAAKHVVMSRTGDGHARLGVIKDDGSVWIKDAPFSDLGWLQVAPASWNVQQLAMSGDTIGIIRDAGNGNHVASFQQEPFAIDGWHDVVNYASEITFDQNGL
jgi:hypothetical protein